MTYLFQCGHVEQQVGFDERLRWLVDECNVLVLESGEVTTRRGT